MSDAEKMRRYRVLRRRRKLMYLAFFPFAVALLLLMQVVVSSLIAILVWPLLLLFGVACMLLMQSVDKCPWCGKSFHTSWQPDAQATGFSALFRKQCANCGEPQELSDD